VKTLRQAGRERLASYCRACRGCTGLPATTWAKLLGVCLRTVRYWETGESRPRRGHLAGMRALADRYTKARRR